MPLIKVSGLDKNEVQKLSSDITPQLAKVIECPNDWLYFIFESDRSSLYCEGNEVLNEVYVWVEWFDRGEKVKNEVAQIITDNLIEKGMSTVTVIFKALDQASYFENGTHY